MIRIIALALGLALATFLICRQGASAGEPIVTDLRTRSPEHLTVGDHLLYLIKLEADEGTQVSLAPGALPDGLVLTKTPETKTRSLGEGRIEVTLTLEVAPFLPGAIDVPPLRLRYTGPTGDSGEVATQASVVVVESVLPASGEVAPRDLKPQAAIGTPTPVWALVAFVALLLALGVVLGLLAWRRRALRRRAAIAVPVAAPVAAGPEDRARAVLDRAGADFGSSGDYDAYYSAIAVTVRDFLSDRYSFPAFALTTRELQEHMVRRGMDRWLARVAVGLLSQCDEVVYAHYRPAPERADADLTAAYEVVEMSRPQQPEPEEAAVS